MRAFVSPRFLNLFERSTGRKNVPMGRLSMKEQNRTEHLLIIVSLPYIHIKYDIKWNHSLGIMTDFLVKVYIQFST